MSLTPHKIRTLEALEAAGEEGHSGRSLALALWPNSPAWGKRTRGQRGGNRAGAMAGTMPMNGARAAWDLWSLGLARIVDHTFYINDRGRDALRKHREKAGS